jgi:hypothetical protein
MLERMLSRFASAKLAVGLEVVKWSDAPSLGSPVEVPLT